jgi:hypothetical protein
VKPEKETEDEEELDETVGGDKADYDEQEAEDFIMDLMEFFTLEKMDLLQGMTLSYDADDIDEIDDLDETSDLSRQQKQEEETYLADEGLDDPDFMRAINDFLFASDGNNVVSASTVGAVTVGVEDDGFDQRSSDDANDKAEDYLFGASPAFSTPYNGSLFEAEEDDGIIIETMEHGDMAPYLGLDIRRKWGDEDDDFYL